MSDRILDLPISADVARSLRLGDMVYLRGDAVVTAGFPTHQRLYACIEKATPPPVDFAGRAFLHRGVMSEEREGRLEALYVNPTTSTRFNAFMPKIISHLGLTIVAGKGGLDESSVAAMQDTGCVYLSMIGGGAPLLTMPMAIPAMRSFRRVPVRNSPKSWKCWRTGGKEPWDRQRADYVPNPEERMVRSG